MTAVIRGPKNSDVQKARIMSRLTTETITNLDAHCERVASFCFPDSSRTTPQDGQAFWLIHDNDQEWVAVIKDGQEIARHNVRLIASIHWVAE